MARNDTNERHKNGCNPSQTRTPAYNSTYKKLAVHWLNEALCFVSSFVVADSLVLRNRQLLVAANRYLQAYRPTPIEIC
jgi:hypothetical protein